MQDNLPILINTNAELTIYIDKSNAAAMASIINNSGATIEQIQLQTGNNIININQYINKNYAIRVANGSNVVVQKI